jgi:GH18 family chitinase
MGFSQDYSHVPDWVEKPEGYQPGAMVKYQGNIFIANFWASKPGEGDANENGWRLHDELYDVTSNPATAPAKIIGYIPTWRKKEGFDYANEQMYLNITHGIISFLMFDRNNLGEFDSNSVNDVNAVLRDIVLTGHRCQTKISIALGGATDYGFLYLMERIGNNPADPVLQKAVNNVVDFVESNGLDGVDLDLECWWDENNDPNKDQGGRLKSNGAHPAGKGLTEFAKQLKQAMPDKIISAALFATSWYGNCYDPGLVEYLDWLGIMTYDLTGSWDQTPVGPQTALLKIRQQQAYVDEQQGEWPGNRKSSANASDPMSDNPILSVEDSLWYWTNPFFTNWQGTGQNLPRNKIATGVPIYGYDFAYGKEADDLSGQIAPGYKTIRYKDLLNQFPDADTAANGNIKVPGNTPRPPFISAPGTYPYAHNIYFETPKTAVTKLNFLKSVGAQGVIIWELSNDVWEEEKSIIQALYKNSGNPEKPTLPFPVSTTNSWMKQLRGDRKLSEFNIPGTHETCALHDIVPGVIGVSVCQTLSLKEQLDAGIRFIDIRCRHIGDGDGIDSFMIHHGAVYQKLTFGAGVRDVCIDFLRENPTECIIMSIKDEYDASNVTQTFEETLDSYIAGFEDYWYLEDTVPILDDVRGKIVLFRRYGNGTQGIVANPSAWGHDATFDIPHPDGYLKIQDEYKVLTLFDLGDKWSKVENLLNAAQSGDKNDWYINFLSGTSGLAWPINVAKDRVGASYPMNPRLFDFLKSKSPSRFGTLLMDFPDETLISTIISLNTR